MQEIVSGLISVVLLQSQHFPIIKCNFLFSSFLLLLGFSFLWIGAQFPQEKFLSYGRILTIDYYFLLFCILFSCTFSFSFSLLFSVIYWIRNNFPILCYLLLYFLIYFLFCSSLNLAESLAPSSCFQHFLEVNQRKDRKCIEILFSVTNIYYTFIKRIKARISTLNFL